MHVKRKIMAIIGACYPWIHATNEGICFAILYSYFLYSFHEFSIMGTNSQTYVFFAGLSFAYQLLYLLDATGFYTPGLHVLGVQVCRATGQELV